MANLSLKIVSNGTAFGTKIFDAETGAELRNVRSITWSLTADDESCNATIELVRVPLEIASEFEAKMVEMCDQKERP